MKKFLSDDPSDMPERIRRGDEKAFHEIHRQYYRPLIYYAYKQVSSLETAQDLVSESFYKLFIHRRRIENLHHIKKFLYEVTRNATIDELRKKSRQKKINTDLLRFADIPDVDPGNDWMKRDFRVVEAEVLELIYREIENLPKKSGQVFRMYFFEQLDTATIAQRLRLSPKTILNHKANAIKRLRTNPLIRRLL